MKQMIWIALCVGVTLFSDEVYEFRGKHFLASYLECDQEALANVEGMMRAMDLAVGACGATILNKNSYVFPPNGLTLVYLLSESHASIHTYPECRACFVDLFTCGDHCTPQGFDAVLRAYLHPQEVNVKLFGRHETTEQMVYTQ